MDNNTITVRTDVYTELVKKAAIYDVLEVHARYQIDRNNVNYHDKPKIDEELVTTLLGLDQYADDVAKAKEQEAMASVTEVIDQKEG